MTEGEASSELVAIGSPGQSLRIHIAGPFYPDAVDPARRAWQRAVIHVEAHPFSGSIETIIGADGIAQYQQAIADFAETGKATLGGNRAAEIRLERDGQVIEVTVTPSGDDPWPLIRYLIFPNQPRELG
jgi:hypothetical protein